MRFLRILVLALMGMGLAASGSMARADDANWPTLTINVGTTAGGSYDTYARLLGRYIGRYLPGNPSVIVQNRPGAGGLIMFNYLYNNAPQDGSELGMSAPGLMLHPLLYGQQSQAQFDPLQFSTLGSMTSDFAVFLSRPDGDLTVEGILNGEPFAAGSPGPGGNPENFARAIMRYLDANLRLIGGYQGLAEVELAFLQGEVDAIAGYPWGNVPLMSGEAVPLIQYTHERQEVLPETPTIMELVSDPLGREVFSALMAGNRIFQPVFVPPGVPAERVEMLKDAFSQAMRDPDLVAEAASMQRPIHWLSAQEAESTLREMVEPSEEAIDVLRSIFAP